MWDIDSPTGKAALGGAWVVFAALNAMLMYLVPGEETIPYHLIWASFALIYGLTAWPRVATWTSFWVVTAVTGLALVKHSHDGVIRWEECSEILLMGLLVALLVWHVDRQSATQRTLRELRALDRSQAHEREIVARFGSHQVRTRLTIARGFTELVRAKAADEQMLADADVILAELDKATTLTTQVLALVRAQTPAASSSTPLVDVDELLDGVAHRWAATVDRRWSWSSRAGMASGDGEQLEAALDCLVENAVKFTTSADTISLTATRTGDRVEIRVQDSGAGIPDDELVRVTQLFETGSTAGARAGTGLGLSIARAVFRAHGGALWVQSATGAGTRVTGLLRVPPSTVLTTEPSAGPSVARHPQGV